MTKCLNCKSFIPVHREKCLSCKSISPMSSSLKRCARLAATAAGASAISMTLMACYGAPPDHIVRETEPNNNASSPKTSCPCKDEDPHHVHSSER